MATRSDAYIQGLLGQIQNNNAMAIGRGDFATAPISVDRVAAEMSAMGYAIPDQTKFNPTRRNPINRNAVDTSASWSRAAAQMPTMDMSAPAYSDDFLASVTADYNNWLSSQGQEPEQPMGMSIQRVGDIPNGMNADMGNRTIERIGDIPTDNVENRSIQRIGDIPVLEDDATRYQRMYDARNAAGPNMVGNVDINHRPILLNDDGSYSTSQTQYQQKWYGDEENGGYRIAHYTPILADGQRMTDEQMQQYLDNVMAMPDPMEADRNALGLLYQVDTDFNGEKITDANLQNAFQYADLWDQNMHTIQDGLYGEEAALLRQLQTPQNNAVSPQNAVQSISGGNTQPSGGRSVAAPQNPSSEDEIPSLTREEKNRTEKFRPNWKEINAEADRVVKRMKQRNPKISKAELREAQQSARDSAYRKQQIKFENSIKPAQNPRGELSPFENVPVQNLPAKNRDEAKARMDNIDEIPTTLTDAFSQGRTPKIQNTKGPMSPFGTRHDIAPADASRDAKYRDAFKARSENAEVIPEEVSRDAKYREAFKARQENAETPVPFEPVGSVATNTGVTSDIVKPGLRGQNLNQNNMVPMEREAQYDVNLPEDEILPIELTDAPAERNTVNSPRADLSGIQFEEGQRDRGDANSHISNVRTVERYLDPNYQMSREEQDDAQEIAHQWFTAHPPREWLTPNAPEELRREAGDMIQLAAKTSNYGAYAAGLMDQITKLPSYLNRSILYTLGSIGMSPEEKAAYRQEINDAFQGLNQQFQGMRTQSPGFYTGGTMAGRAMQSMAVDSVADATGITDKLGVVTDRLANTQAGQAVAQLAQNVAGRFGEGISREAATQAVSNIANSAISNFGEDLINDTLPSAYRNYENGMTAQENALATLQNIGENALIDVGIAGIEPARQIIPSLIPGSWGDALRNAGDWIGEHSPEWLKAAGRWLGNRFDTSNVDLNRVEFGRPDAEIPRLDADAVRNADTVTDAARTADTATDAARTADTITDAARAADVPRAENPFDDAPRNAFDDVPRPEAPEHWFEEPRAEQPRVEEPRPTVQEVRDSRNANPEAEPWERSVLNANSRLDNAQVVNERLSRMSHNIDQAVAASGNPRAEQALDDFYNAAIERRAGGGVDFEDAAERLKQVLNQMGLDTKDVDEVQKSLRAYESLSPLFDAQKASQHPEVYDEMIGYLKQFEDKLDQYQDGTVSFDELQQAMRDAQNAVGRMDTAVKNAALGDVKAIKQQYKDELYAIREEFGIHSQKQNVVVGISKETADALKYEKQSPEQAIESINGMMNRDKNKSFVTLAIQPDKADVFLGTDDVRSLIDRVTANRDARWQALHPEPQFPNLQKSIYYEFAETAQEELNQLRNAEKVWTDQDEEDLLNLFTPEEREAYLANKAAQAEAPRPAAMEEEPIPTLTGEVPEEPAIETHRVGTAAMDTEEIPTLTGEVPEVPRAETAANTAEEIPSLNGETPRTETANEIPRSDAAQEGPEPQSNTGFGGRTVSDVDAAENDVARKVSRNFQTVMHSDSFSDAQKEVVLNHKENWLYKPDVEKELAAKAEEEVQKDITGLYYYYRNHPENKAFNGQDMHNMQQAAMAYDAMATEAEAAGNRFLAQQYRNKAADLQKVIRESGTGAAQDLATMSYFYGRTAEGAVANGQRIADNNTAKYLKKNPKVGDSTEAVSRKASEFLKEHDAENILSGTDEVAKTALKNEFSDAVDQFIEEEGGQLKLNLTDAQIDQLMYNTEQKDLKRYLDSLAANGSMGISPETEAEVKRLFEEASQYHFDSREYVNREYKAYAMMANDLAPNGASFKDKFDQWRYLAMLLNPRTHIRNIVGNLGFALETSLKNDLAAIMEASADRVGKAARATAITDTLNDAIEQARNGGDYDAIVQSVQDSLRNHLDYTHMKGLTDSGQFDAIVRNVLDNATNAQTADQVDDLIGSAVDQFGGIDRTKALLNPVTDRNLLQAARQDGFATNYRNLSGSKWIDAKHSIEEAMPTWNTNSKIGSKTNAVANWNKNLLAKEDTWAMMNKYQTSLAGYLKANGLDETAFSATDAATRRIVNEGREYALKQAQEAAFHQSNNAAERLSEFTRALRGENASGIDKLLGTTVDMVVPFKKTPANILKSAIEYSPATMPKILTKDVQQLAKGAIKPEEFIDKASKSLTGTGLFILGAIMAREGWLVSGLGKSDRQAGYEKILGRQQMAFKFGDHEIGISQFAPVAIPLLAGAAVTEAWANSKGDSLFNKLFNASIDSAAAVGNTMLDTTMLEGVVDTLMSVRYATEEGSVLPKMAMQVAGNGMSQMIPSLSAATTKVIDPYMRSTYANPEKTGAAKTWDQTARYAANRILGAQQLGEFIRSKNPEAEWLQKLGNFLDLPKAVDAKGQYKTNPGDNVVERAINQYVNPTTVTTDKADEYDNELLRISEATGSDKSIPVIKSSEGKLKNGEILDGHEYEEYSVNKGGMQINLAHEFLDTDAYERMDDFDREVVLNGLYNFAKHYNQAEFGDSVSAADQKLIDLYDEEGMGALVDNLVAKRFINNADLSATDRTRSIYDEFGEEGVKRYSQANSILGAHPKAIDVLAMLRDHPELSDVTIFAYGSNWKGTFGQDENGVWTYTKPSGTVVYPPEATADSTAIPTLQNDTAPAAPTTAPTTQQIPTLSNSDITSVTPEYLEGFKDWQDSTKYQRYMSYAPESDANAYFDILSHMDTNQNRALTIDEITQYIDALNNLTQEEKAALYAVYANANWRNPYL